MRAPKPLWFGDIAPMSESDARYERDKALGLLDRYSSAGRLTVGFDFSDAEARIMVRSARVLPSRRVVVLAFLAGWLAAVPTLLLLDIAGALDWLL